MALQKIKKDPNCNSKLKMPKIDQWSVCVCVADCIGGRTGMVAVTAIVWHIVNR